MKKAPARIRKACSSRAGANTSTIGLNRSVSTYGKVQLRLLCDEAWMNLTPTINTETQNGHKIGKDIFGDSTYSFINGTYEEKSSSKNDFVAPKNKRTALTRNVQVPKEQKISKARKKKPAASKRKRNIENTTSTSKVNKNHKPNKKRKSDDRPILTSMNIPNIPHPVIAATLNNTAPFEESTDMFLPFGNIDNDTNKVQHTEAESKPIKDMDPCTLVTEYVTCHQSPGPPEVGIDPVNDSQSRLVASLVNSMKLPEGNISLASMSHVSLSSTVLHHAANIDMNDVITELILRRQTHHAAQSHVRPMVAQSTPVGKGTATVRTRSFFKNLTSTALPLSNASENFSPALKDIADNGVHGSMDLITNTEQRNFQVSSAPTGKTDKDTVIPNLAIPSHCQKVASEPQLEESVVEKVEPKRQTQKKARKAPRPKTKKAPVWKKCPGSTIRKKFRTGKSNDSILHQIMMGGSLKPKMSPFDDSGDVYHVNSNVSSESSFAIKLPGSTATLRNSANKDNKHSSPQKDETEIPNKAPKNSKKRKEKVPSNQRRGRKTKTKKTHSTDDGTGCGDDKKASSNPLPARATTATNYRSEEVPSATNKQNKACNRDLDCRSNSPLTPDIVDNIDTVLVSHPSAEHSERVAPTAIITGVRRNRRKTILIDNSEESTLFSTLSFLAENGPNEPCDGGCNGDIASQRNSCLNLCKIERRSQRNRRKRTVVNYKNLSLGIEQAAKMRKMSTGLSVAKGVEMTHTKDCMMTSHDSMDDSEWIYSGVADNHAGALPSQSCHIEKLNLLAKRNRRGCRNVLAVPSDDSTLFSSLSFVKEKKTTSMSIPMHAFSTINKSEENKNIHGDLLSDDENVNTKNCFGKRASTPAACNLPSKSTVQLYDQSPLHSAAAAKQCSIDTEQRTPTEAPTAATTCGAFPPAKKQFVGCSPIAHVSPGLHMTTSSSSGDSNFTSPLLGDTERLKMILHPRIASLKSQRATSTPNSGTVTNRTPTDRRGIVLASPASGSSVKYPPAFETPAVNDPSPNPPLPRDAIPKLHSKMTPRSHSKRSPGSHLSHSVILFSDNSSSSPCFARERRSWTLDQETKEDVLGSVKVNLGSVILSEEGHADGEVSEIQLRTPNQEKHAVRFSMPCPDLRVMITPMRNSFLDANVAKRGRLKSMGFVNALTPKRARDEEGRILTARQKVLYECDQIEPVSFEEALAGLRVDTCIKLGEGLYGEVFRCDSHDQEESVAIKVIPIEGSLIVNNEKQKTFEEMLPEIVSSKELHALHETTHNRTEGFIELYKITCARGTYPSFLVDSWDRYNEERTSDNDRPDTFGDDQLYLIFQFADGGADVEHFKFRNSTQAFSVMQQVCAALAVAEKALQFEHRDLHWGNVLVTNTKSKTVPFTLNSKAFDIQTNGVKASIIDFTLSRLSKGGVTVCQDLAQDPELFELDSEEDYQFEIYRLMKKATKNRWSQFQPKTNIFWMHYLNDKFKNKIAFTHKKSKPHRSHLISLNKLNNEILNFDSCSAMILSSDILSVRGAS